MQPDAPPVEMTVDEYETVRLIDLLGCTQEECARQMGVARTTVQAVYDSARRKLAKTLVFARRLEVRGGDYVICPQAEGCCGQSCPGGGCTRQRCRQGGPVNGPCPRFQPGG
jgi:predicted DNA-binding protein (UPF0251 family)